MCKHILFLITLSFGVSSWTANAATDFTADGELRNIFKPWEKPVTTDIDDSEIPKGETRPR